MRKKAPRVTRPATKADLHARIEAAAAARSVTVKRSVVGFHKLLHEHAMNLITAFGVFELAEGAIRGSAKADDIRRQLGERKMLVPLWLSFSTGIEILAKAACVRHGVLSVARNDASTRAIEQGASNHASAAAVYDFAKSYVIDYSGTDTDPFEQSCVGAGILNVYDINLGTLGGMPRCLQRMLEQGLINLDEKLCVQNALQTLADIRRNVDVHTFHGLTVGANLNGDLDNLYLPAANILLDIFNRPPVSSP